MKVYSISKLAFWAIFVLIIALPVSRHWRLLSSGERTTGMAGLSLHVKKEGFDGSERHILLTEIYFQAGDSIYLTYGPPYYNYEAGTEIKVVYDANNPTRNCLWNASALYLTGYTVLVVMLLTLWGAFYMSFNQYVKKKQAMASRTHPSAAAGTRTQTAIPPTGAPPGSKTRASTGSANGASPGTSPRRSSIEKRYGRGRHPTGSGPDALKEAIKRRIRF